MLCVFCLPFLGWYFYAYPFTCTYAGYMFHKHLPYDNLLPQHMCMPDSGNGDDDGGGVGVGGDDSCSGFAAVAVATIPILLQLSECCLCVGLLQTQWMANKQVVTWNSKT